MDLLQHPPAATGADRIDVAALAGRIAAVRGRVAAACARAGRSPASVAIVAVTKGHPAAVAQAAVDAGLSDLGESRVQELLAKTAEVGAARWHLVGRLQRTNARKVVGHAVLVHSLDRRSLADELSQRAAADGVVQRVLVQVNVDDDPAKGGCPVDETLDLVRYSRERPHLVVEGLMTVLALPSSRDHDTARSGFRTLRALRDDARAEWPEVVHLSMGMTNDFEPAVEEGATILRLGTVLFGPRSESERVSPEGRVQAAPIGSATVADGAEEGPS